MICPQCQSDLGNHPGKYCIVCGATLPTDSVQSPAVPRSPQPEPRQDQVHFTPSSSSAYTFTPAQPPQSHNTYEQQPQSRNTFVQESQFHRAYTPEPQPTNAYTPEPGLTPLSALDFGSDRIEPAVIKLGLDLCTVLEKSSRQQMVHGNIHPENIFIDDFDNYQLGHSGFSGNPQYQAPERAQGHSGDVRSDLYSVGLVLYQLLNGNRLPNLQNMDYAYSQGLPQRLPAPRNASAQMALFLNRACAANPNSRFASPSQMKAALYQVMNGSYTDTGSPAKSVPPVPGRAQVPSGAPAASSDNAAPPYTPYSLKSEKKSTGKKSSMVWLLITGITVFLCVIAVVVALLIRNGKNNDGPQSIRNDVPHSQQDENNTLPPLTVPPETTVPTVSDCVGMSEYEASTYFTDAGCTVSCEYEYSDFYEEGRVISQSIPAGSTMPEGQTVILTISLGKDECPYDYTQKVVVSAASGSSYGTLELYEWEEGDWVSVFSCDATLGSKGIGSDYGEGKKRTPEGIFKLGIALSANSIPNDDWPFQRVTSDTCIVDDTDSRYYNTIQSIRSLSSGTHYDPIGKTLVNGYSNICIYIEHNGDGLTSDNVVAGKGSVITICGRSGSIKPTLGCVDISSSNMNTLISLLDYTQNPHIEIVVE